MKPELYAKIEKARGILFDVYFQCRLSDDFDSMVHVGTAIDSLEELTLDQGDGQ
jgi:hypothetical protein